MLFNPNAFITAPSHELLNMVKKSDLLHIAARYESTTVKNSMLKHKIKTILIQVLVDKEILDFFFFFFFCFFSCFPNSDRFANART